MTTKEFPGYYTTIDVEEIKYLEKLNMQLEKSDLYTMFRKAVKMLRHALHNRDFQFEDSAEQSFGKEVIYRTCEESLAYLSNIREGLFFAANHHTRALLEQYAIVEYVFSEVGKKNNFLHRFHTFPKVAFYKVFHQYEDAFLKFSKEICDELFSEYKVLNKEVFDAFGTRDPKKLLKLENWRGNALIKDLFEGCPKPDQIKSNYAKLCLFAHVSSLCRRSELELFPEFKKSAETMLLITVQYAAFSYVCLKQENLFDFFIQEQLDDIFLPLAEVIGNAHKDLINSKLG